MAGFNAIEYARNVGKSVKFISFTAVKNVNPTLTQYASDNISAVRDMYDSIKDFKQSARTKVEDAWKGETGKFGRDLIKNALEDIKSGKFYNEERSMNAMNDFMDIDIDFDDSSDSGKSQDTADQTVTSGSMDYIIGKSAKSNAKAAITSADIVSRNIKGSTKTILAHNERMTGNIVTALAAVHGSIIDLNKSLTGPLNTHIQNSTTFYKTATEQLALQTGYLKELKELFTARYGQTKSTGGFGSSKKVSAWKSVMGGDLPDLIAMGKNFKDRVKNEASMLSMIASFFDNDMLKMMRASDEFNSPIATLLSMGLSGLMKNSKTGRGLDRFTNNLGGMFATGMGRINAWGRSSRGMSSWILGPIARMFGSFIPKANNRFNTANYEKGRVDWTGMADKALREVIPTQLAQILSALTGNEPRIFDYNTGRWTTARNISNQFKQNRRRAINQSQGRFRDQVIDKFNTAYGTSSSSKASQSFKQDYDNLMDIIARTNVDPTNPTELKNYLKRKGLLGSGDKFYIHEENFDRIMQILGFTPSSGRFGNSRGLGFGFAKAAYNAREANTDYLNSTSATGGAYNIVRGGGFSKTGNRNIGGFGIASVTDDKGNNIFFYLQNFYSDLKAIRHALVNGSPNTRRKAGRKKYGSSISDEDIRKMTEVPDNSKSSSGFGSSSSRHGNIYYDPNVDENLEGGFRKTKEQSIFERAVSDDGLSDEELKNMNWISRTFYGINRRWKKYNKDKDSTNTVFDAFSESLMDVMFGKERDKHLLDNGIAGLLQELPNKIAEATTEFGKKMWDRIKDSKFYQSMTDKVKSVWKGFKSSDGFKRYKDEMKSTTSGFMKNAFSTASKDFKGAFGAVRSHLQDENEPGTAAYGGQVLRSGVVSVSEGEYIIPAEYNPFYTGHMGKSSRRAIESMNKRGFLNSASSRGKQFWGEYAKGGFINPNAIKNFIKNRKGKEEKKEEKQYKSKTFRAVRFGSKVAKKAAEKSVEFGSQEAKDVAEDIKNTEAYQAVKESLYEFYVKTRMFSDRMFGQNETYQKGKAGVKKIVDFIKPYLPETLAGGTIGAIIGGALTGSPLGLLGGLIIGGGVNLARHSEEFSRTLFGDIDELGNRTGGVFSKKISNFLTKKVPGMAQYGAIGSLLGAAGLAPGGILGGFVIGAGLNLLKDTEDFRNVMLGSKGVDGKRRGGLVTSIQLRVIDPIANYIQDELKGLKGYVKKWALDPLKNIFNPVRDWIVGVSSNMMEGINRAFKDRIVKPLAEKLDTILKPISGIAGWVAKKAVGLAKGIGTLPGRMVNTAANRLQLHNIRKGYSSLSPEERLEFMNRHSVRTKGANLATRLVNKLPGGSRVTGAIGGFMDRHSFIGRHSGFSAENQAYTRYAANASADELEALYEATIGRDRSIRDAKKNNNKIRQDLRDTLIASMDKGGLNDPKARRTLMRLLDSEGARKGERTSSISQWIEEQEAAGKMSHSNAEAAKQLVAEKMGDLSKVYQKEQSFNTPEWEARTKEAVQTSGLSLDYLRKSKAIPRQILSDLNKLKDKERRAKAESEVAAQGFEGPDKKLKEAIDGNPVEKEKLGILERIANMLSSLVSKETGQPIENNNSSSFGKTKSSTSSNKSSGKVDNNSDKPDIKTVTTDDGTQIQLRRNSEGGYSPDMSDAATAEYYNNKEQDRSIKNNFFSKIVGAGGLLDMFKNFFGKKSESGEKEPSLLEKLISGAKNIGSSIISSIGGLLSGAGGLSNLISTGLSGISKLGTTISTKLGGLGNIASLGTLAITAHDFIKNIQENGLGAFIKNPFAYSDQKEAEALGYKRTYYDEDEYQRDYTLKSANKNIVKYGLIGGSKRYGKVVNKAHNVFKKGLEYAGEGKLTSAIKSSKAGKAVSRVAKAGNGFLTGKVANLVGKTKTGYNLLDKAYSNKILTTINDKGIIGGVASGASKVLTTIVGKIKDVIKKILTVLGKNADDAVLANIDNIAKSMGQSILKGASGLASKLAKALPVVNWIMYGLAFENGMEDAYAVLQISPQIVPSVSMGMRALSGGATVLSEVLFGMVKPEICANILMTIIDAIGIGDFSDIRKAQAATEQEYEQYNATHPGDEYNNVYEYLKNVYSLYTIQDRVKKVVGGAAEKITGGIKSIGTGILNTAKNIGKGAVNLGKNIVSGAKEFGGKALTTAKNIGKGALNTAKKFGKGIANTASNIATGAVSIAKKAGDTVVNVGGWISEGFTSITKMTQDMNRIFFQKDTNMSNVLNVQPQVSEDNPLSGVIKNIGGVVKVVTVPSLFIKGLGSKLYNDGIKPIISRIADTATGIKTTISSGLDFMAKGDPVGLLQYNTDESVEDGTNPIGFLNSATGLITKLSLITPTSISWLGHKVTDAFKVIQEGFKSVAIVAATSYNNASKYYQSGDLKGLLAMDSSKDSSGENTTSGPLDFISTMHDTSNKLVFAVPTAIRGFGIKIKEFFKSGKEKLADVKEMVETLWEFTDAEKRPSMDGYDAVVESFANSDSGFLGSVMNIGSTIIGGLMKGIISIVRPIRSFGSGIKDKVFGIFDSVKDFITGSDSSSSEATGTGSGIHVSQYGSDVSRRRFGRSTVGRNGCGPAVAATVLRSYGRNVDLDGAVNFAQANNYVAGSSGVGTKASYFGDILGRNGIRTRYTNNISDIDKAVGSGNPTILLGQDGSNTSKSNSPFGPNPHYVLARGKDSRGNVIVDDPELGSTAIYNNRILKKSKLGILTGGDSGIVTNTDSSMLKPNDNTSTTSTQNASSSGEVLNANDPDSVAKYSWNFFRANGFSEAATAGTLGNMKVEGGFNAATIQNGGKGPAAGLFQWENYNKKSARWAKLNEYAQSKGKNWTDTQTQLEYALKEMSPGGDENWAWKNKSSKTGISSFDEFKNLNDIGKSTIAFMRSFERPGVEHLDRRLSAATEYYNKFTGSSVDPNMVISGTSSTGTTSMSSVSGQSANASSGFDLGSMLSGIFGNVFRAVGNKIGGTIGGFISSVFGGNTTDNTNSSSTSFSGIFGSSGVSSGAFVSSADASATEKKAIDAMNSIMGKNSYTMSADRERVFDTVDKGSSIGYGDCSATVRKVLQRATGINIGGNTDDQYNNYASRGGVVVADSHGAGASKSATIDLSKLRPGDALYYSRPDSSYTAGRKDRVGHVEMYMGDGKRAGHGSGMGPRISNATDDQNRFLKAIRFIKDSGTNISSSTNTDTTKLTTNTVTGTDITATGSGLPIIDFTRNEYNDISRRIPSVRKHSNKTGGASGIALPTSATGGSYSNIDPQTMMQFFNQVIALLTSIAQSSGYTPTIVSVLQMMTGTMNAMNSPKTEDTKNQIDQNIALMMQKLDTISQTL